MPSPFPGMDPYIEQPNLWSDFHNNLSAAIQAALNRQIRPRYVARLTEYATYDVVAVATTARESFSPDVSVWQATGASGPNAVAEAVAPAIPAPVESAVDLEVPLRLHSVEVREVGSRELVTVIEVLSPVKKRPGHKAHSDYLRKRQNLLRSQVHWLELDLLRGGERPPLARPVPRAAYYVTLSRVPRRPTVEVWPIQLWECLPQVPVPLLEGDPDAVLDLSALVAEVYERGGYDAVLDYAEAPPPPVLTEGDGH